MRAKFEADCSIGGVGRSDKFANLYVKRWELGGSGNWVVIYVKQEHATSPGRRAEHMVGYREVFPKTIFF